LAYRKALVVMVSLDGCPYCKLVRESYLAPLRGEGQPVVQIELAQPSALIDAAGRPSTHAQVARSLRVRVAPTVLFLGRGGVEVAARLVGVANADFYGAYLSEQVAVANRAVAT
ncbi:MAG TPA: thioredoxin fold domain-containing protein, partial [Rubrivivax sp.]|nr:thioredoxin fold domain-containing protein [Rubrivivax sp.]